MIQWIMLVFAIGFEVAGTTCMKLSEGFTKLTPSVAIFVFYFLSFGLLTLTLKRLEVSLVYAIWSGMGTLLITVIGIVYFGEAATTLKLLSILLIIIGVVGLNLGGARHV